jgi:hypothetical protein
MSGGTGLLKTSGAPKIQMDEPGGSDVWYGMGHIIHIELGDIVLAFTRNHKTIQIANIERDSRYHFKSKRKKLRIHLLKYRIIQHVLC